MGMERSVHHLRLRGPSEAAIRRAALKLEDALRTASLPDAGARIVLVRRLALGRIDADAAPATLALSWERMTARTGWRCVHGSDAQAGVADAVWFADALDAHVALALRLLRGPHPCEWFWSLAVPGWTAPHLVRDGLRVIVQSLLAREEAASALPAWCAALARAGQAACLPDVFADDDLPALQRLFAQAPHVAVAFEVNNRWPAHPSRSTAKTGQTAQTAQTGDVATDAHTRRVRIAAALLTAGGERVWAERLRYDVTEQEQTDSRIVESYAATAADRPPPTAHTPPPSAEAGQTAARTPESDTANANHVAGPTSATHIASSADIAVPIPGADTDTDNIEALTARPDWSSAVGETTAAGGIAFLLPVLQRLGYPEWLRAHPAWARHAVLERVIANVFARLEIAPDDPAWEVTSHAPPRGRLPRSFIAPAHWHTALLRGDGLREYQTQRGGYVIDASGHLLLAAWSGTRPRKLQPLPISISTRHPGESRDPVPDHQPACQLLTPSYLGDEQRTCSPILAATTHAWTTAIHRWLRRHAHIGLHDLVRRPARLALTATHLDLHFHPTQADLRLRRHGLDLDPGWLPWFGRVVSFYYEERQP